MRIVIGSDNVGFALKEEIKTYLKTLGTEVEDCGCYSADPVDYPDVAKIVAEKVVHGEADRGILVCGTGIGMAMAANKIEGIRAAQCYDEYSAERAAKSNNAHVITIGSKTLGAENARRIVKTWIESEFTGGPSAKKIEKIMEIEKEKLNARIAN